MISRSSQSTQRLCSAVRRKLRVNRQPNSPVAPISSGVAAGAVHRDLVEAERGDVEDVVEIAGIADADIDEQVVDQHRQQYAVDHAQHIEPPGLRLKIGVMRPETQGHLDRTLALHAQVQALGPISRQLHFEQVVALADLTAGPGAGVAGVAGQAVTAFAVRQVQLQAVERRIGHLQQPASRALHGLRTVMQIDAHPMRGARIAGIEHRSPVRQEVTFERGRGDLVDLRVA